MTDSIRWQIIESIFDQVSRIRRQNAFETEIGKNAYLTTRSAQSTPCVAVFPGVEEVSREYRENIRSMAVRVEGVVEFGDDDPVEVSEKILADIIEAMTGSRWTLAYTSGGQNKPQVGDTVTGATSGAVSILESYTTDSGAWADGDAAGDLLLRRKIGEYMSENLDIGSEINLATTDGSVTVEGAEELVTGDLADDIVYLSGGIEEFPGKEQLIVGMSAEFNIVFRTLIGNPYNQPS